VSAFEDVFQETMPAALRAYDPEPVAPDEPDSGLAGDVWERAVPEKQRQAVTLRFVGDLTHREIGDAMQTSEAAARRNVFEAIKRLRACLEPITQGAP
jgi:DNA-directed RNA polymerase specialized sigma24 family protein